MFYVYQLIDPRDDKPFYIGKGKGRRIDQHEDEAKGGKKSRKCQRIRDIWEAGLKIKKDIIKEFDDEIAAYNFEYHTIDKIGLANLTNEMPGGMGPLVDPIRLKQKELERKRYWLDKMEPYYYRFKEWEERGIQPHFPISGGIDMGRQFVEMLNKQVNDYRRDLRITAVLVIPLMPIKEMENTKKWDCEPASHAAGPRDQRISVQSFLANKLHPLPPS